MMPITRFRPSSMVRRYIFAFCSSNIVGGVGPFRRVGQRKVLLVFDEAQHLSIACLETLRELLDQPPHCGLLFAGTHELEQIFTRQALELEQWRSRFHAGQALPGISEEEAADIVHSELGLGLSPRKIQKLIAKSRITDLRNGGKYSYVSARRLFWVIRELQAVPNEKS